MTIIICPTCESRFDTETSTAMPFCSSRCMQIDLGRWINEEHSIPIEREDEFAPPRGDS